MKNFHEVVRANQGAKSFLIGAAFAIGLLVCNALEESFAEQPVQALAVAYRDGKITAIYETTFQIDHKTYGLISDAVILDRHGDPLKASDLRVDVEVKYHLFKGTTDKIDQMILFLPE